MNSFLEIVVYSYKQRENIMKLTSNNLNLAIDRPYLMDLGSTNKTFINVSHFFTLHFLW